MDTVPSEVLYAAQQTLGGPIARVEPITIGGHTSALRLRLTRADGRTAFMKIASESRLRTEQHVYQHLTGRHFLPGLLADGDEDGHPWLLLEDLGTGGWPPPWPPGGITAVRDTLDAVHATPVPPGIGPVGEDSRVVAGWRIVDEDPTPLLRAGVDAGWLKRYLPDLIEASRPDLVKGDALVHLDVRSDNVCLTSRGAVLVDWHSAAAGNPAADLAFWLPSLAMETGLRPDDREPDLDPGFAVLVAGFYACIAGPPERDTVPRSVRALQRAELNVALAWAARVLGIPGPPRGPGGRPTDRPRIGPDASWW